MWNEPNLPGFWMPQCRQRAGRAALVSPGAYAALLAAAYREIKAANPRVAGHRGRRRAGRPHAARPASPARAGAVGSLDFTRLVAREGPPIDAWSLHLYPIGSPLKAFFVPSWSTLPQVVREVDRLRPGAPIHVTETGYHTSYNRFHRYFVSEAQQAAWLDETLAAAAAQPRVQVVTWFNFQDNPLWTGGLLRGDGTPQALVRPLRRAGRRVPAAAGVGAVSEAGEERLDQVQAYYDRLAPRLVAVESRNWHLQSRMSLVLETIDRYAPSRGGRVLDVGCGTGFLLERLAERGFSGIGIDLSPESVEHARSRLRDIGASERLDAQVGSAYEPPAGALRPDRADRRAGAPGEPARLPGHAARAARARRPAGDLDAQPAQPPGARGAGWPRTGCRASGSTWRRWTTGRPGRTSRATRPRPAWRRCRAAGSSSARAAGSARRSGGSTASRAPARAELALSRTPLGRFGFYICLGFRAIA